MGTIESGRLARAVEIPSGPRLEVDPKPGFQSSHGNGDHRDQGELKKKEGPSEPLSHVDTEDPGLSGNPVEMWSYPVIQDGLIYVVDVRNGLYVVRYHGRWSDQVGSRHFLEGNSNLH